MPLLLLAKARSSFRVRSCQHPRRCASVTNSACAIQVRQFINDLYRHCYFELSGIGMTSEVIQHLFNALDSVDLSDPNSHSHSISRGSGASLAVAQKIIGQMGGSLRVTSSLNRGSTFVFDVGLSLTPTCDLNARLHKASIYSSSSSSEESSGAI